MSRRKKGRPSRAGSDAPDLHGLEDAFMCSQSVPAAYAAVGARVWQLLRLQIDAMPDFSMFDTSPYLEVFPATYIWGLVEAALEEQGFRLEETGPGVQVLHWVLVNCVMRGPTPKYHWPEQGLKIIEALVKIIREHASDPMYMEAFQAGREDFAGLARRSDDERYMRFCQFFSTSPGAP